MDASLGAKMKFYSSWTSPRAKAKYLACLPCLTKDILSKVKNGHKEVGFCCLLNRSSELLDESF